MLIVVTRTKAGHRDSDHGVDRNKVHISDIVSIGYERDCGIQEIGYGGWSVVQRRT
jgi:hypothetical protein